MQQSQANDAEAGIVLDGVAQVLEDLGNPASFLENTPA